MSIHTLILTLITTLTDAPDDPNYRPEVTVLEGQHFCCAVTTSGDGTGGGEGCVMVSKDQGNSCSAFLHCKGNYTIQDGTVTCY